MTTVEEELRKLSPEEVKDLDVSQKILLAMLRAGDSTGE